MVTNTTLDTLNYAKDLDIEYNIKFLILFLIFTYSLVLSYVGYKWEANELYKKIIKVFILFIPSWIFLFFTPVNVFYLFRQVSWEIIYGLLLFYYTYVIVVLLLSGILGGFTMLANLLGIDTSVKKMEMKTK